VQIILAYISDRMRTLPAGMLELVCQQLSMHSCEQQSVVFNAGEDAVSYYVVLQGRATRCFMPVVVTPASTAPVLSLALQQLLSLVACHSSSRLQ
jgi:hypothetical protein